MKHAAVTRGMPHLPDTKSVTTLLDGTHEEQVHFGLLDSDEATDGVQ